MTDPTRTVALRDERDVAAARNAAARACDEAGAKALRKVRFVTAVSEIARNAIDHGGGGSIEIRLSLSPRRITALCVDDGPGIANMDLALTDGYSTARSMGKGLGGARRLVDRFEMRNRPEGGLEVWMSSAL